MLQEKFAMISDRIDLATLPTAFEALKQPNRQIKVMFEVDT